MMFVYKSRFKEDINTDIDLNPSASGNNITILFAGGKGGNYPVINRNNSISDILENSLNKLRGIAGGYRSEGNKVELQDIQIQDINLDNYSFPKDTPSLENNKTGTVNAYIITNAIYIDDTHEFLFGDKSITELGRIYANRIELRCQMIKNKEATGESLWAVTLLPFAKMDTRPTTSVRRTR